MMKMNYDEMQKQKRDRIGTQSFFMLVYLMMLNIIVFTLGIQWLDLRVSTMLLILVSVGVYKIRLVASGAFEAPGAKSITIWRRVFGIAAVATAVAVAVVLYFTKHAAFTQVWDGYGALALLIVSAGFLLAIPVAAWVRRKKDKDKEKDE